MPFISTYYNRIPTLAHFFKLLVDIVLLSWLLFYFAISFRVQFILQFPIPCQENEQFGATRNYNWINYNWWLSSLKANLKDNLYLFFSFSFRNFSSCHRGSEAAADDDPADATSLRSVDHQDGGGSYYEPVVVCTTPAPPRKSRSLHLSPEVNTNLGTSNGCTSKIVIQYNVYNQVVFYKTKNFFFQAQVLFSFFLAPKSLTSENRRASSPLTSCLTPRRLIFGQSTTTTRLSSSTAGW